MTEITKENLMNKFENLGYDYEELNNEKRDRGVAQFRIKLPEDRNEKEKMVWALSSLLSGLKIYCFRESSYFYVCTQY